MNDMTSAPQSDFTSPPAMPASGFDAVKIWWKGTEYTVAANRVMGLLASIEETLSPGQNQSVIDLLGNPHKAHLTKLASAYGNALRYAGCAVSDETVYLSLARDVQKGGVEGYKALRTLCDGLMVMFFPEWAQVELGNSEGERETQATPTPEAETPLTEE